MVGVLTRVAFSLLGLRGAFDLGGEASEGGGVALLVPPNLSFILGVPEAEEEVGMDGGAGGC